MRSPSGFWGISSSSDGIDSVVARRIVPAAWANRFDRTAQFVQVLPRSRLGQNVFIFGRSLYPYLFLMGI